jgi:hypothetical protein
MPLFIHASFCSVDLGSIDKTSTEWKVTVPAKTQVQLSVVDENGDEAWSKTVSQERLGIVGIILTFPPRSPLVTAMIPPVSLLLLAMAPALALALALRPALHRKYCD